MSTYRIVEHVVKVPRTDEWNQRTVSDVLYWIEGPGICRPATDIEVDVWQQGTKEEVISRTKNKWRKFFSGLEGDVNLA